MDDLVERLRKAAHIEPEEVAELMEEAAAALEAAREDWERLDALESIVMESDERALLLHHGLHRPRNPGFCGLGLSNTNRTLRQAIDQARGKGGGG